MLQNIDRGLRVSVFYIKYLKKKLSLQTDNQVHTMMKSWPAQYLDDNNNNICFMFLGYYRIITTDYLGKQRYLLDFQIYLIHYAIC